LLVNETEKDINQQCIGFQLAENDADILLAFQLFLVFLNLSF